MKRRVVRAAGIRAMLVLGLIGVLFGATSAASAHRRHHSNMHCVVVRRHHHKQLHCTLRHKKTTTQKPPSTVGTTTTTTTAGGTGTSGTGTPSGTGSSGSGSGTSTGTGGTPGSGGGGTSTTLTTGGTFSYGELQDQNVGASGCGTNMAGEPAIHVSRAGNVFLGSELGLGGGSELWRGLGQPGGAGASGCSLEFRGSPNAVSLPGVTSAGASGGDIDIANASAPNSSGNYNLYVASLNAASVNVATSTDNGTTFTQVPVQNGMPLDDREWIAAFGANTSLLTYHDVTSNNIDVLRSDDGGQTYNQISQVIPASDYKSSSNELGNLVIDHNNLPDSTGDFYAYQAFVAPSDSSGQNNNEAWLGVSADGGKTWSDNPIPCSKAPSNVDLNHNFPNVSVAPNGNIWYAWSDDNNVYTAESTDHGVTWTCSSPVSTNTAQAIFPWLVATDKGVDLVYYGSPTAANQTWYVYFAQSPASSPSSWGPPEQLMAVHQGPVCESGANCTSNRQLFDDFGVDTDSSGWAHIAYSADGPNGSTYTGYAVEISGTQVGPPNN